MFEYTGDGCLVPKDITSVRFNDGLQTIGDGAFFNCKSLKSIKLPHTVVEIGRNAFRGCSILREVTLNDGLQEIGAMAFFFCKSLEYITLPSTVTEIGNHAFGSCSDLSKVTLNDGLTKIGDYTFCNCTSLESIKIGSQAFYYCYNLREVILNDGLQKIGINAFFNCTSLKSIKLPSTVTEIGYRAFSYCSNLREVKLNGVPQNLERSPFLDCDALERFLFPTISYRLGNIIRTRHWGALEDKVNHVRGVVQWESDKLFVSIATHHNHNWNDIRRDLGRITRLVSHYELKEATTTFELALWKSKLDQADAINTTNRSAYRIEVPGPVKDTILQYL